MKNDYLLINKRALPEYFEKVIEARMLIRSGAISDVSEAVRKVGISRSTYYKYKDYVYLPAEGDAGRMAIISLILSHEKGILSKTLNQLSSMGANILTIMQNPPIGQRASVVISMDVSGINMSMDAVLQKLQAESGVEQAGLIDFA